MFCDMRKEICNVLLEAAIVIIAVSFGTKLWARVACEKILPPNSGLGAPCHSLSKGMMRGCQRSHPNRSGDVVESNPLRRSAKITEQTTARRTMELVYEQRHKLHVLFSKQIAKRDVEGILCDLGIMAQQGLRPDDRIFEAIFCHHGPPNFQSSAVIILRIFEALLDAGFTPSKTTLSAVIELLRKTAKENFKPNAAKAASCAQTEAWELALNFLRSVPKRFSIPVEGVQYSALGLTCKHCGNAVAAQKVRDAMIEDLGASKRYNVDLQDDATKVCEEITEEAKVIDVDPQGAAQQVNEPMPKPSKLLELNPRGVEICVAQGDPVFLWKRLVVQFGVANGLDRVKLEKLPKNHLRWIIYEHFLLQASGEKRSASEVLLEHMREATLKPAEFWDLYPTAVDVQKRMSRFIEINSLDVKCSAMLTDTPLSLAQNVMDHEFVVKVDPSRGTASSKVVGSILRFRRLGAV